MSPGDRLVIINTATGDVPDRRDRRNTNHAVGEAITGFA
jgi:hypothetical protein